MTERTDQRICIKFWFNLGKSYTETIEMIQKAFVDESMGISQIKEWYRRFKQPKKARQSRSHVKWMLIVFFDCEGVAHYESAPRGQTLSNEYYVEVLKRLGDAMKRKKPHFWSSGDCGFFTTITRQPIHRNLCSNFRRNTRLYSFASLRRVPT